MNRVTNPPIDQGPTNNTPEGLVHWCKTLAETMQQQAISSKTGTALGGHPYPHQLYNLVAETLQKAGTYIEGQLPKPPEEKAPVPVSGKSK